MEHNSPPGTTYLNYPKGLKSWITTLDHKRIGIMYLATVLFYFFLGGIFATLIRIEHMTSGAGIMDANQYNRVFTYHGAIMVFMVIIPLIPAAVGNFILPMQLGAKDVAFPRLNLLSYYIFLLGSFMALATLFFKGVDTGWTFYTPYSTRTSGAASLMVFAAFTMGFSSILTGLNFIATVHKLRAPGQTWSQIPLFIWGIYATSIIQVLATPVLALTLVMMAAERIFNVGFFDPALGGDPVLFQHFFWFYSHPAVYIMILPAMGVINEIIPVFSRKPIFGYKAMAGAIFGIAGFSFIVWGHHMFTSGQSYFANILFSFLTVFVGVPTGIKIFNWLATMYRGSIRFKAPMLYALGFLWVFLIGGLTGIVLASVGADIHFHDTYYVVAHFHYVMVGGAIMAFLGGLHYWFPKFFGKMYNERAAAVGAFLVLVGFNLTFMPQFIMGQQGAPRRYYNNHADFLSLNNLSTYGSLVIAAGLIWTLIYLVYALKAGKKASDNPWEAATFEWETSSPPPMENFRHEPVLKHGPYDYSGIGKAA